jgi:hypothetical protein
MAFPASALIPATIMVILAVGSPQDYLTWNRMLREATNVFMANAGGKPAVIHGSFIWRFIPL